MLKTFKVQSVIQGFSEEFMKSPNNELYCNVCCCTVSCNKCFLVESHGNTSEHQKTLYSSSQLLVSHTLQTILRSSNTDFVEKVTIGFLCADIPLCKLNKKHIHSSSAHAMFASL